METLCHAEFVVKLLPKIPGSNFKLTRPFLMVFILHLEN